MAQEGHSKVIQQKWSHSWEQTLAAPKSRAASRLLDHPSLRQHSFSIIIIMIITRATILSIIFNKEGKKKNFLKNICTQHLWAAPLPFSIPLALRTKLHWTSQHPWLDAPHLGSSGPPGVLGMPPGLATLPCSILSCSVTPAWPGHICSSCSSFC